MSTRIKLYVVDVPRFEQLLDRSIGSILQEYAMRGTDSERIILWHDWPRNRRYLSVAGRGVMYAEGSGDYRPADFGAYDPFLARPTRDYLREEDSFALNWLLKALSRFPPEDFVREITSGQRRWWLGSFLDYAERSPAIAQEDYARLELLWQKVLRGHACGKPVTPREFNISDFDFPVLPAEDSELWMGVWSEEEARFMVDCLRRIRAEHPRFRKPPGKIGLAPDRDEEWDEWVNEMLNSVLGIEEALHFQKPVAVSFIS